MELLRDKWLLQALISDRKCPSSLIKTPLLCQINKFSPNNLFPSISSSPKGLRPVHRERLRVCLILPWRASEEIQRRSPVRTLVVKQTQARKVKIIGLNKMTATQMLAHRQTVVVVLRKLTIAKNWSAHGRRELVEFRASDGHTRRSLTLKILHRKSSPTCFVLTTCGMTKGNGNLVSYHSSSAYCSI